MTSVSQDVAEHLFRFICGNLAPRLLAIRSKVPWPGQH